MAGKHASGAGVRGGMQRAWMLHTPASGKPTSLVNEGREAVVLGWGGAQNAGQGSVMQAAPVAKELGKASTDAWTRGLAVKEARRGPEPVARRMSSGHNGGR